MALRVISREEAIATLRDGRSITAVIRVTRPIQVGLRPLDDQDERFAPIFCGTRWVEEPDRFIVNNTQELLELIRALKRLDVIYCDFFDNQLGTSGLVDITVYANPAGVVRPRHQPIVIDVDPYRWEIAYGQEWIRVDPEGRLADS